MKSIFLDGGFIGRATTLIGGTVPEDTQAQITTTYNGVFHQNVPGPISMSISNVSTGNITSDETLVVAVCIEMSRATYINGWVNSLTVDGNSVTIVSQSPINENLGSIQTHTVIGYISGISSSTVTVVVGYSDGGSQFRGSCASYKLNSNTPIEVYDSTYDYSNSSGTKNLTTDVFEGGVVIYQGMFADENTADTWAGLTTENYNISHPENNASLSGGVYLPTSTGSHTTSVTIGGSATTENALVAASFKSIDTGESSTGSGIFNLQAAYISTAISGGIT